MGNTTKLKPLELSPVEVAKAEIAEEDFREAVEQEKAKLRHKKTIRELIFPFKITIERINK